MVTTSITKPAHLVKTAKAMMTAQKGEKFMAMINGQSWRSACGLPHESKYCVMKKQTPKPMKESKKHIAGSPISKVRIHDTKARKKGMENKLTPRENAKTILHLRLIPLFGMDGLRDSGASGGSVLFIKSRVGLDSSRIRELWAGKP